MSEVESGCEIIEYGQFSTLQAGKREPNLWSCEPFKQNIEVGTSHGGSAKTEHLLFTNHQQLLNNIRAKLHSHG